MDGKRGKEKERESGRKCRGDGMTVNRQVIAGRTGELMPEPCVASGYGWGISSHCGFSGILNHVES